MKFIFNTLILIQLIFLGFINNPSPNIVNNKEDMADTSFQKTDSFEIWQLDYYPDSVFITRDINFDHIWESSYAYNIQFSKDSCQFIGWHESFWYHLAKFSKNEYLTIGTGPYYWLLEFTSKGKLMMREIRNGSDSIEMSRYYPYHCVRKILTQDSLQRKIAKDIFAGTYKLLFNDTFTCEKKIVLDEKFRVKGIEGITNYRVETEVDWDFAVENAFWLTSKSNESNKCFSYKFFGDTLLIRDYKISESEYGDFPEITNTRIKMLKISL